ncbi:MAG: Gfo/Idh/MocA family oxidoreductase [Eubacteriales bacterium]|nr:Gfo/Idh/MocA family oxidoreductase [Eubacteriales bacterium]
MGQAKVRVGVIGAAGFIGSGHLHRLATAVDGAYPTAVYDVKRERLEPHAERYGVKIFDSADELIASEDVDAVLIASWDATHAAFTKQCIEAGKPVFCEKPLATTLEDCQSIVEAEKRAGKPLVQVGFMRRFDPDYRKIKEILRSGELGAPLMAHCISRTPKIASGFTDSMQVTNIAIHEIDVMRWLLDEPIVKGQMIYGRPTGFAEEGLHDPQLALMWSKSGCLIDVECAANSYYGYEIQCEIVCEKGTIRLPDPPAPIVRSRLLCATEVMDDWSERFPKAYQAELQHWIDVIRGLRTEYGPGSEDGYAACAVADAMIRSQATGLPEQVTGCGQ